MRLETISGFAPTKYKEEKTPVQSKVEHVRSSVSPFEIAGLSLEQREAKKKEIFLESQKDRSQFLEETATSRWVQLYDYITRSSIPNQVPVAGSLKMLTEAALKKTAAGKALSGKERVFHSIVGASGFATWGALSVDRAADTNLTKYGVAISLGSSLLVWLNSESGKSFIKKTLEYAGKQASNAKDALVSQSGKFFSSVNMAFDSLDISEISEKYRQNLILELQQSNNG